MINTYADKRLNGWAEWSLRRADHGLGVDDSRFRLHIEVGEPMRGGAVVIKVSQQEIPAKVSR